MATLIAMPRLGMIMSEGTLSRWLKAQGEQVQKGQPIAEITTDKITYEIEAPEGGIVHQVVPEGTVVEVEGPLAYLLAPGEAPPARSPAAASVAPTAAPQRPAMIEVSGAPRPAGELRATPVARRLAAENGIDLASVRGSGPGGRIVEADVLQAVEDRSKAPAATAGEIRATPVARRLAAEHGVDLATVSGSGPGGRIVESDILRLAEERTKSPAVQTSGAGGIAVAQRIPLTGSRGVIARRMSESLRVGAQLTLSLEADAGLLRQIPAVPPARDAALVKVLALALRELPALNSTVQGEEILIYEDINVGVAISADDLLTVPVVRNADQRSLAEISRELRELIRKARRNALTLDDLTGGTFTLTNLGPAGIDSFTPIINPPQSGILGVGRVAERAVVVDGQIVARPTVWLSLTFDHRVVDGAPAARFLQRVAELLRDPKVLAETQG